MLQLLFKGACFDRCCGFQHLICHVMFALLMCVCCIVFVCLALSLFGFFPRF